MINRLCEQLSYPEMFNTRRLPTPANPEAKCGFERVLRHMGGIIYDFKSVPKFTPIHDQQAKLSVLQHNSQPMNSAVYQTMPVQQPCVMYGNQQMQPVHYVPAMMMAMPVQGMPQAYMVPMHYSQPMLMPY